MSAKAKLTDMQLGWLVRIKAQPGGYLSRMHIAVGTGAAIPSLLRRGLAEWDNGFLVLTPAGNAAAEDYEICWKCDDATHIGEAACIHCGATKPWARDFTATA